MAFEQGDLIVALDPHKEDPRASRPFVIVSTRSHPFHGKQYIAVAVSSRPRNQAIKITTDDLSYGALHQTSYVNTWAVSTIESEDIGQQIGSLTDAATRIVITELEDLLQFQQPPPNWDR